MIRELIIKLRKPISIMMHSVLITCAYIIAFNVRFEFVIPPRDFQIMINTFPTLILIKLIVFYYFGLYSGLLRYVSMVEVWQILRANVVSTIGFIVFLVFSHKIFGFPRSILIIDWILCVGFVFGIRIVSRGLKERYKSTYTPKTKKAIIVGAGEAGILVLKELKNNLNINVVGFIDDDRAKKGMQIHGKKVLGDKNDIETVINRHDVEEIIIAMPSAEGKVVREVISYCTFPGVKTKIVPGMYKILNDEMEVKMREVQPDDLLGREKVIIDEKEVNKYLSGKVVLITGAGGSIGSELSKQIAKHLPQRLILLDYNENDVYFLDKELRDKFSYVNVDTVIANFGDISLLKYIFGKYKPQIVFHAAAFKHVPLMEEHPASAVINNVIGTRNIIYASDHYGVKDFVLISSDKAVKPTSIMGTTKRIAEMIGQAKNIKSKTNFMAVRFGNVLGSKGSVVPLFKKQIEEEKKVTVTHREAKRFFMSIKEAVQLVLQAGAIGKGGEVFILDMGEQIKITDLAENLIKLSGLRPEKDVVIEYIGLRPGEKLYEELLRDTEKDIATKHEKIFITVAEKIDISKLNRQIKELERFAILRDDINIRKKLQEIVPAYVWRNNK